MEHKDSTPLISRLGHFVRSKRLFYMRYRHHASALSVLKKLHTKYTFWMVTVLERADKSSQTLTDLQWCWCMWRSHFTLKNNIYQVLSNGKGLLYVNMIFILMNTVRFSFTLAWSQYLHKLRAEKLYLLVHIHISEDLL